MPPHRGLRSDLAQRQKEAVLTAVDTNKLNSNSAEERSSAGALLVAVATLPILQGVLITPIMAIIRDAASDPASATFYLRVIVAAPAATIVLLLPLVGRFADRVQRRGLLIFGLVVYALCGVVVCFSPHLDTMFVSRLFLGIALACLMTALTALTGDHFEGAARERILGLQYAATSLVAMGVPLLAGFVALTDWRLNFLFYLVAVLMIIPAMRLPDRSPVVRASAKVPSFNIRPVIGVLALICFGTMALWLITIQLAFHLEGIGHGSALTAGLALGTPCVSAMALGLSYARIKKKLSFRAIASLAFLLIAIGYAVIAVAANVPVLVAGLLLAGGGFGLNPPNCAGWLLSVVPPETRARASASLTFAICAGQLAAPFVYQPMVAMAGSTASFGIIAGCCLIVAAVGIGDRDAGR